MENGFEPIGAPYGLARTRLLKKHGGSLCFPAPQEIRKAGLENQIDAIATLNDIMIAQWWIDKRHKKLVIEIKVGK